MNLNVKQKRNSSIRILCLILFLAILPLPLLAQWQTPDFEKPFLNKKTEKSALRAAFIENPTANYWDLTYNRLELKIDPAIRQIEGTVVFKFKSLLDHLQSVTIDLDSSLKISSIKANNINCNYIRENGLVQIDLPAALNKNDTASFSVEYGGVPTLEGLQAFTQQLHNDVPVIFTLSEPWGAKEWWPCKESLTDKIDSVDVWVETPSSFRTASNGKLMIDTIVAQKRLSHWKHRHPIATYLVFISSTNYEVYSDWAKMDDGTQLEILNYVYPESLEAAKKATPYTADYIHFFSSKFIPYPFKNEKYGHAQFGWGGGMENQTMSSVGLFDLDLLAHELAHQWFGDYVTCASWNDIWLNEGFATYLAALVSEEFNPANWDAWKKYTSEIITSIPDGAVYVENASQVDRIFDARLSYRKGGMVLHMLRGQLGDARFFSGMQRYLKDPRAIDGFATTAIFRENMEQAADTTLTEFFADWILAEGHPVYDFKWDYTDQKLEMTFSQQPSTPNGPFFEMKLPVTIYRDGQEQLLWLANTKQNQQFSFLVPNAPDSVVFNKDRWILCTRAELSKLTKTSQTSDLQLSYQTTQKELTVHIATAEQATYTLYDLQGRICQTGLWTKNNPVIQLHQLHQGVYMLRFKTDQETYHSSFICK